jgi:hypothetical protein
METSFVQKAKIKVTVVIACMKSTIAMKRLRSALSTRTPATGMSSTMGTRPANAAIEVRNALPVVKVTHKMTTNWAIDDPRSETICPPKKSK